MAIKLGTLVKQTDILEFGMPKKGKPLKERYLMLTLFGYRLDIRFFKCR